MFKTFSILVIEQHNVKQLYFMICLKTRWNMSPFLAMLEFMHMEHTKALSFKLVRPHLVQNTGHISEENCQGTLEKLEGSHLLVHH